MTKMEERIMALESRIIQCKTALTETDYLTLKAIEGEDMTKYGDWRAERKALREEINKAEAELQDALAEYEQQQMSDRQQ